MAHDGSRHFESGTRAARPLPSIRLRLRQAQGHHAVLSACMQIRSELHDLGGRLPAHQREVAAPPRDPAGGARARAQAAAGGRGARPRPAARSSGAGLRAVSTAEELRVRVGSSGRGGGGGGAYNGTLPRRAVGCSAVRAPRWARGQAALVGTALRRLSFSCATHQACRLLGRSPLRWPRAQAPTGGLARRRHDELHDPLPGACYGVATHLPLSCRSAATAHPHCVS